MARGDPEFAKFETKFILTDPRYLLLTLAQRAVYDALWATAVSQRREVIWLHGGIKSFSCGIKSTLVKLSKSPHDLITVFDEEHVWVHGVRRKHNNLQNWHDDEDALFMTQTGKGNSPFGGERRVQREENTEKKVF